jgi:hypothetical protein
LYLVKNGVPFDVAFSLPVDERLAYVVVFGTLEGRTAHSGDPERSIRSIMNTGSGDHEHLLAVA